MQLVFMNSNNLIPTIELSTIVQKFNSTQPFYALKKWFQKYRRNIFTHQKEYDKAKQVTPKIFERQKQVQLIPTDHCLVTAINLYQPNCRDQDIHFFIVLYTTDQCNSSFYSVVYCFIVKLCFLRFLFFVFYFSGVNNRKLLFYAWCSSVLVSRVRSNIRMAAWLILVYTHIAVVYG